MKKQLANYFDIIHRDDVASISGGSVTPKTGKAFDRILTKNNIAVLDQPAGSEANPYFSQSARMVCSKLTAVQSARYRNSAPVILVLYYTDGTALVWGQILIPARVILAPELNHDILEIARKSAMPLL